MENAHYGAACIILLPPSASMTTTLSDSVKYLRGVGPQRAAILEEHGIATVSDLLSYLPFRYEDRIRFTRIAEIIPGQVHTICAEVSGGGGGTVRFMRGRSAVFHVTVRDGSGMLHARFFHGGYLAGRLKEGQKLVLHGKVDRDAYRPGRLEMVNPQIEVIDAEEGESTDSTEVGRIVPIYEAMGGISSRILRRIIYNALQNFTGDVPDLLSAEIRQRYRFPARRESLLYVHFPPKDVSLELLNSFRSPAQTRLIFEEFFYYQFGLALRRQTEHRQRGIAMRVREDKVRDALKRILPFKPTAAQKRVLADIAADLERPFPMHRLLEGDVGSGKTIVALEAATIVIENGYQVALMAPTEILAAQHAFYLRQILSPLGYVTALLTGSFSSREKDKLKQLVSAGLAQVVVGTHALLEKDVAFHRLGLAIIDEQHRFGVLQRLQLVQKGVQPDVLVMTATPIPRTLAMTLYGDLDVSTIDELPPGRKPIITKHETADSVERVYSFLKRQVEEGRQAYVVYPVIEESETQAMKAAQKMYEHLSREVFPDLAVGLMHGRLSGDEKEDVMHRFKDGRVQILVSTTVIEVGMDVPNASVMLVEQAERFGLAQLHQLRGRVGRGAAQSHCILVTEKMSDTARERIRTLVESTDGFHISEVDLKLRGPGEFFGTKQSGLPALRVANILRDAEILEIARREAVDFVARPPAEEDLRRAVAYIRDHWQRRYGLVTVG